MYKYVLYFILFISFTTAVYGQYQSVNVAVSVQTVDNVGQEGHILSLDGTGRYVLSTKAFDQKMFGVVVNAPLLSVEDGTLTNAKLMASSGEALVLVNGESGAIKKGDFITSSSKKGVGQKASTSGYVLGIALQDYAPRTPAEEKLILANIKIGNQYISNNPRSNLVQVIRSGLDAPSAAPVDSLRYIIAGLVVCAAFIIGFTSFGRTSGSSIEAMGRNPLAKNTIRTTVIFNFILTGLIMFSGIFLAYLVLIL